MQQSHHDLTRPIERKFPEEVWFGWLPFEKAALTDQLVGVLGCTGSVGQRFILLLVTLPHFKLQAIGASSRSANQKYKDVVQWKQSIPMPEAYGELEIKQCEPQYFQDCDIIFSGLDSSVAGDVEMAFLKANYVVFSNAKNHRQDPHVPLILPMVNLSHLDFIPVQKQFFKLDRGLLVCNSNCSLVAFVVPFAALQEAFGPLGDVSVVTSQSLSGAGYPGVSSLDIQVYYLSLLGASGSCWSQC